MDFRKLEEQIKLSPNIRDFRWVKKQYDKGRLTLRGQPISAPAFEQFRKSVKTIEEIYEGQWDFDVVVRLSALPKGKRKITIDIQGVVILLPEVIIKNSKKKSHKIVDLYINIMLGIRNNRLFIEGTYGGRGQLSYAEWSSAYFHSHLPTRNPEAGATPPFWGNFCTGSGHINEAIAEINSDGFTIQKFTSYLLNLYTLVSWESLEGGPHHHIENIIPRSGSAREHTVNDMVSRDLMNVILNYHRNNNLVPKIDFTIENNQYVIKDNETFEEFLKSAPLSDVQKSRFLCMRDETGRYYSYGSGTSTHVEPPRFTGTFIFQGEKKKLEVYGTPGDRGTAIEYFVHPRIKEFIIKELQYDSNKKIIRKSTIDRYKSEVDNATEHTPVNPVPVLKDS